MVVTDTDGRAAPNRAVRRAGYRRKAKEFRLHFEGTSLEGLEVHMHSVPVGTVLQIAELAGLADEFTPEGIQTLGMLFQILADALIGWNLEESDGTPVPASIDGVHTLDLDEALLLIQHWIQAVAGVARPLEQPSTGGGPSPVESLPMEPLSQSHAS